MTRLFPLHQLSLPCCKYYCGVGISLRICQYLFKHVCHKFKPIEVCDKIFGLFEVGDVSVVACSYQRGGVNWLIGSPRTVEVCGALALSMSFLAAPMETMRSLSWPSLLSTTMGWWFGSRQPYISPRVL